jgi:hypothetical protein
MGSNRRGMLSLAIALVAGMGSAISASYKDLSETMQRGLGERIRYQLENHYKIHGRSRSHGSVAHAKRVKQTRRNIAKRNRSASQ